MSKTVQWTTDNKVTWYTSEDDINDKIASVLGEKFVKYRKAWDAVSNFETLTEFPLYLQVELNQVCNLKCPMCPLTIPESREKYITDKHISWEMYEKIILEAEKYNCPSLNPQGVNEPLLDQDLENYIKFAKKHGFIDIMMNTNATLLSEERSKKLVDSGLTRLRFSLDAFNKETYEKIRIGANYEKVMRNIDRFIEIRNKNGNKLPFVGVNLVQMKTNEDEVHPFIEYWREKVDFVVIQNFLPPELEGDYSDFFSTTSKFRENISSSFNCQQPWQRMFVHNNGVVSPCCALHSIELSLGNFNEHSLHELWMSEPMNNLRKIHKEGNYAENEWCKKCVNGMRGGEGANEFLQIKKMPEI